MDTHPQAPCLHMCCWLAQACSQEGMGQWVSHTQAEIRRGRWGFLPPVLCFKFVMAGSLWAGLAAVHPRRRLSKI